MATDYTEVQALFPVQFPRLKDKDQNIDDYNASIAQNENNLSQNQSIIFEELLLLRARIKALEGG